MMKSTYNMILSILGAISSLILGIIICTFQGINHHTMNVVLFSFISLFISSHYIFEAISFSKEECKARSVLYRLSKVFEDISILFLIISLLFYYPYNSKWILFSLIILFTILEIIIDSLGKVIEIKYLFQFFKLFLIIFLLFYIFNNIILILSIFSVIIYFISYLLGEGLSNKIVISYSIIGTIIFGICSIFL